MSEFRIGADMRGERFVLGDWILNLEAERDRLRDLLAQVAGSGVAQDDPRIDWVDVQIDNDLWAEINEAVTS